MHYGNQGMASGGNVYIISLFVSPMTEHYTICDILGQTTDKILDGSVMWNVLSCGGLICVKQG